VCSIGGDNPMHGTFRAAASLDVGLHRLLRLASTQPLSELVAALNEFQPDLLTTYPSIGAMLADEASEGRLKIRPRAVSTVSEVRTADMEHRIKAAWGVDPFNYYGITEVFSFGTDCSLHRGIHAYEDLFLFEVVDDAYRPVPFGQTGERLLITNLYNLTQPLIRYEVSDKIVVSPEPCPCGRPYRLVSAVEGRSDDVLYLPGNAGGEVPVHCVHFTTSIEKVPSVRAFQVVHEPDGVHVRVVKRGDAVREEMVRSIHAELTRRFEALGCSSPIHVEEVAAIERDVKTMGKLKMVISNVPRAHVSRGA
jgi:phenylacetate-coenzyme A ligase PaaK-like adenylate-forming protein